MRPVSGSRTLESPASFPQVSPLSHMTCAERATMSLQAAALSAALLFLPVPVPLPVPLPVRSFIDGTSLVDALDAEADPVGQVVFDGVHDRLSCLVVVDLAHAEEEVAALDVQGGGQIGSGLGGGELGQPR